MRRCWLTTCEISASIEGCDGGDPFDNRRVLDAATRRAQALYDASASQLVPAWDEEIQDLMWKVIAAQQRAKVGSKLCASELMWQLADVV